jgi:hypothetical protein
LTTEIEMPSYFSLLKTIGIPGIVKGVKGNNDPELEKMAKLNKISLLYMSAINVSEDDYSDLVHRNKLLYSTLADLSLLFNKHNIEYCVFKTIKPFPTTPSDVDVLLSKRDFIEAESLLMSSGFTRTARDAYSSTLEKEMIVDLQLQPSVSNVPYLPKMLLMKNAELRKVNDFNVSTLNPEAELIVIAAHSVYKEQMFTLNDYYAITMLAEQVDPARLLSLVKSANVLEVVRLAVALCSQITESVFNVNLKISQLSGILGQSQKWQIQSMPIKFAFPMIIKLLLSRATKDKEMRSKVLPAIIRVASPGQLMKLFAHVVRSTY